MYNLTYNLPVIQADAAQMHQGLRTWSSSVCGKRRSFSELLRVIEDVFATEGQKCNIF